MNTDRFILLPDNTCCRLVSFSQSISPVATKLQMNQLRIREVGQFYLYFTHCWRNVVSFDTDGTWE